MTYGVLSARAGLVVFGSMLMFGACAPADDAGVPAATVITADGADHRNSRFSSDGSRMAYLELGPDGYDLLVANADGTNERKLADLDFVATFPVWSDDGTQIALGANLKSLMDAWLFPVDGSEPRQLTDGPGLEVPQRFHPDGQQLVYCASTQGGEVNCYVLGMEDGSTRVLWEERPVFGSLSPDGTKLMFVPIGMNEVWVADADGGNARQLPADGFTTDANQPDMPWSPDGTEILYVSKRTGTGDVWVVPANGGEPRQITRDVRDDFAPEWSSDGEWIVFLSERGRQTDVWVVPAAGGEPVRVTNDVDVEIEPSFRPGTHTVSFHKASWATTLWIRSMADGSERQLTPSEQRVGAPDVAPDGSRVLYRVARGGGVADLYVVPLDGGEPVQLTSGSGNHYDGQWAPDGSAIAFVSNRAGSDDVWIMDADGQNPRRLTDFPEQESALEWSHDGQTLYFLSTHEQPTGDLWKVTLSDGELSRVTNRGFIGDVETSRTAPAVFVSHFGGEGGQIALSMLSGSDLVPVYNRTSVGNLSHFTIAPSGDRIAVPVEQEGGTFGSAIVTASGEMQPILGEREFPGAWSPDGEHLVYFMPGTDGGRQDDLALYSFADGSTTRLTETPEDEVAPRWTADGSHLVFGRENYFQRIVQVDMSDAIGGAR